VVLISFGFKRSALSTFCEDVSCAQEGRERDYLNTLKRCKIAGHRAAVSLAVRAVCLR
jgi:hypothetical protein